MESEHPTWEDFQGRSVFDRDGNRIGDIDEVYVDPETRRPSWGLVHTGLLGSHRSFLPLAAAEVKDKRVIVGWKQSQVQEAPSLDAQGELSKADEQRLMAHYGMAADTPGPTVQRSMGKVVPKGDVTEITYEPLQGNPVHARTHAAVRHGDLTTSMTTKGVREVDDRR